MPPRAFQAAGNDAIRKNNWKHRRRSSTVPGTRKTVLHSHRKNSRALEDIFNPNKRQVKSHFKEKLKEIQMGTTGPFERVAAIARLVSESDGFNQLIIFVIFIASVMVGVQTYESMEHNEVVNVIDAFVLGIFTLEVVIKVVSEGKKPWLYFVGKEWRWNNFDFAIVVLCMPMWGNTFRGGSVAILRLLRLMRVMKIVEKIPQLQIIVMGLIGGLKSVGYILLLLFLLFYLYAIAGITLFRNNDPFHYGDVLTALNSLFRMATMEDWTDM